MLRATNRRVTAGTVGLNVLEWGTADQPVLLLLHGLASSSHMFDLVAPRLAADFHVVAVDQRGHGLSDRPDSGYDFASIAADVDSLLAALGLDGLPLLLAGHSWGASTTLYYAATRPHVVRRAILIDGALRSVRAHFASLDAMAPPQYRDRTVAEVKQMIRERWLGPVWRPELEPLALSIYDLTDPSDVQPHLTLANHMQIAAALWDFEPAAYYARARCPLLSINAVGRGAWPDAALRVSAAEAMRLSRDLEVIWLADTIHDIPWQRPAALADLMRDFLLRPEPFAVSICDPGQRPKIAT